MAKKPNPVAHAIVLFMTLVSAITGIACSQDGSGTKIDQDSVGGGKQSISGGTDLGSGGGEGTTSTTNPGTTSQGGHTVAMVGTSSSGSTGTGGALFDTSSSGGTGTGGARFDTSSSGGAGSGGARFDTSGSSAAGIGGTLANTAGTIGGGGSAAPSSSPPDAGPDALVTKDALIADALIIPDLPTRQDSVPAFWTANYATNCTPPTIGNRAQSDGHHRPGENCMTSGCHLNPKRAEHNAGTDCRGSGCHNNGSPDGSGAPAFLFGGTAYRAGTLAAEARAEVAVKTGNGVYLACSASNGNFWYLAPNGTTSLTWTGSTARLRNANGEAPMMALPAAGCNATACHTKTLKITAP